MLDVALLEPEIAGNAGQIARTCVATGSRLHLVRPLGFHLGEAALRRAGMDYWARAEVEVHASYGAFRAALRPAFEERRVLGFTTRTAAAGLAALPSHAGRGLVLMFGPESRGLPAPVLAETTPVRLPMVPGTRSLNLSAAVAAALYLLWSRRGFDGGA